MALPFRVHLIGFSAFERSALESYFRLAANRSPAYQHAGEAADAHFLVVDADHSGAVRQAVLGGRVADSVFIGAQPPDGALAWMMRPIDPLHVLRQLDTMVAGLAARRAAALAPGAGVSHTVIQPPRRGPVPARRADDRPKP